MNLLFTNIGRRTYLIDFALSLSSKGYAVQVFASDCSAVAAGLCVEGLAGRFLTPPVSNNETEYADVLLEKCLQYRIDCVIPLTDYELVILANRREQFRQNGITVIVSDADFTTQALDKWQFFQFCSQRSIPVPVTYNSFADIPPDMRIVRKKRFGSAGAGFSVHTDKNSLNDFAEGEDLVQPFLDMPEYGMDIFNDLNGNFLHASFRRKIAMRAGETDKAEVFFSDALMALARDVSAKCRHIGNLDTDFFMDEQGRVFFVDFNPRFGGGYPFSHLAGFDYIQAIVDQLLGKTPTIPEHGRAITAMKGISLYCQ
jgi:carbamoyl-phosphate synthase large subunit